MFSLSYDDIYELVGNGDFLDDGLAVNETCKLRLSLYCVKQSVLGKSCRNFESAFELSAYLNRDLNACVNRLAFVIFGPWRKRRKACFAENAVPDFFCKVRSKRSEDACKYRKLVKSESAIVKYLV